METEFTANLNVPNGNNPISPDIINSQISTFLDVSNSDLILKNRQQIILNGIKSKLLKNAASEYNLDFRDIPDTTHRGFVGYLFFKPTDFDFIADSTIQFEKPVLTGYYYDGDTGGTSFLTIRFNQDGTVDDTFGVQLASFGDGISGGDNSNAVIVDSLGKIVVAGYGNFKFALIQYDYNGTIIKKITTQFPQNSAAVDIALQADGKIIAVGNSGNNFAITRYNIDLSLDTDFGLVVTPFRNVAQLTSVAIQSDGKIVASGIATDDFVHNNEHVIIRYNQDGTLDSNFNNISVAATTLSADTEVAITNDDKIIFTSSGSYSENAKARRYLPNGELDTSFGIGGVTELEVGSYKFYSVPMMLQKDGKIVIGGTIGTGTTYNYTLMRLNTNGSFDISFGIAGRIITPNFNFKDNNDDDTPYGIAIDGQGRIYLAGIGDKLTKLVLARYTLKGKLDHTFGIIN